MRELEFRAFYKPHKKMCYEFGNGSSENQGINFILKEYQNDENWVVMQYTGLKDKNDKKIFEGDVVRFEGYYHKKNDVIGYIAFNEKNASFGIIKVGGLDKHILPLSYFNDNGCDSSFRGGIENSEVIGNVYENPKLLEPNNE